MTQLIVAIEDVRLLPDIKKAIALLRGVGNITESEVNGASMEVKDVTLRAMRDAREGHTIKCESFEDYLEKVK